MPLPTEFSQSFPTPVVPRGKAMIHSDEELAAQTSPEALRSLLDKAAADFVQNVPGEYGGLIGEIGDIGDGLEVIGDGK